MSVYGLWVSRQSPKLVRHTAREPGLGICVLAHLGSYGWLREAGLEMCGREDY